MIELIKNFCINGVAFIIILSIIVFIHELGHYLIAILNGVKVDAFSIGFGKEIWGRYDKKGTRWSISCVPFGGYVKFFGDEDASSSTVNKEKLNQLSDEEKDKCLYYKTPFVRLLVAFAGPFFNFVLAFVLLTFCYRIYGFTTLKPVVNCVIDNSPAMLADIKKNDKILEINNKKINSFNDIQLLISTVANGEELVFKISRDNEILYKNVKPTIIEKKDILGKTIKTPQVGIGASDIEHIKLNLFDSMKKSIDKIYSTCTTTLKVLWQMITRKRGVDGLGGPIKIAQYSGAMFKNGFESTVLFIAMISISLGLMNLLPIPALDGGHILLCLIAIIRRKELPERLENILSYAGFGILIVLMIFSTIKDLFDVIFK